MPNPALAPALVSAGGSLASSALGAYSTAKMNRKTMKWNEHMYDRQRADSLADYTRQNEYNSPTSQMARLREAGLNPNLVYGDGATQNAAPIRSTDVKPWNPEAPKFDIGGAVDKGLGTYYNTQIQQAQIDNLKKDNTIKDETAALVHAQTLSTQANTVKTALDTESGQFDLSLKSALKEISMEAAGANLEQTKTNIKISLDNNERQAALTAQNLQEAAERILTMRAQRSKIPAETDEIKARIQSIKQDSRIKELDINLRKMGINPSDPTWQRVLAQLLGNIGNNSSKQWDGTPLQSSPTEDKIRNSILQFFNR